MNSDLSTQRYHKVLYYNLDVIISVGYRINSLRATKFRIWSTSILKEKFGGSNLFGVEKDASLVALTLMIAESRMVIMAANDTDFI